MSASAPADPLLHDPYFGSAYTDVDEWRDTPIRHRYVHGVSEQFGQCCRL
jgi:hypothetical protein